LNSPRGLRAKDSARTAKHFVWRLLLGWAANLPRCHQARDSGASFCFYGPRYKSDGGASGAVERILRRMTRAIGA